MTSSPRMFRRATTPSPTSSPRGSSTPTVLRAAFQESPTVPGGRAFSHRVFHQFERKREGSLRHAPRSDAQLFAQSRRFDHRFCHGTASFPRGHASKLFGGDRAILGTRGSLILALDFVIPEQLSPRRKSVPLLGIPSPRAHLPCHLSNDHRPAATLPVRRASAALRFFARSAAPIPPAPAAFPALAPPATRSQRP